MVKVKILLTKKLKVLGFKKHITYVIRPVLLLLGIKSHICVAMTFHKKQMHSKYNVYIVFFDFSSLFFDFTPGFAYKPLHQFLVRKSKK